MEAREPGSALDGLISSFNKRIAELQDLVIARNVNPASSIADLSAIDAAVKAMELQVQAIKKRMREEAEAIPKAKKLIEASLRQQKVLQKMCAYAPLHLSDRTTTLNADINRCLLQEIAQQQPQRPSSCGSSKLEAEAAVLPKGKKGRTAPPLWYITAEELDSVSSYMRGRLTLDKVNAAINEMAAHAEANSQLIAAPKKKLSENLCEKALELRDIATTEPVKGKHFFLESDMKGPVLKLDNTGKSILTVLRHLGRISEIRIAHNRVIILSKPQ